MSGLLFGLLLGVLALAAPVRAELMVWVDRDGRTHVTDDPSKIPPDLREHAESDVEELRALWDDGLTGPSVQSSSSSAESARSERLLRGALADLERGETARAASALASVLEKEPNRAEAHWYLALLDWQRGRLASSEAHLRAFLSSAGPELDTWRVSAERRLARIEDERRLLVTPGELELASFETAHFRVQIDEALRRAGAKDLAPTVLRYLEDARTQVGGRLGVFPVEPTGVVLYGRAAYHRAHAHRFSFQTVGFFDGRIHVASRAHPAGSLRTLLFHEYTHALFSEQTGGHKPFWLNEGLAEVSERQSKGQPAVLESEWVRLEKNLEAGNWISLSRLAPSFSGLDDGEAKLAYLESTAAAAWIESQTDPAGVRELLRRLGRGEPIDIALRSVVGTDTAGIETAVRSEVRQRFAVRFAPRGP